MGQDVAGKHPYHKLTALGVRKMSTPGRYADGNGLYLVVDSSGAKRWMQRLIVQGKHRDLGLVSVSLVSLDDANRYIRNAGAADTKARARLPYVAPAKPDKRLN